MPLLKRARLEVYLPDDPKPVYGRMQAAIETEFIFTFGGCTVIKGIKGLYLRSGTTPERDKVTLIYADMPLDLKQNMRAVSSYADAVREACTEALPEQSVLVVVDEIYHSVGDVK